MELDDFSGQLAVADKVWRLLEDFQTLEVQCRQFHVMGKFTLLVSLHAVT